MKQKTCYVCGGLGKQVIFEPGGSAYLTDIECPRCKGSGRMHPSRFDFLNVLSSKKTLWLSTTAALLIIVWKVVNG